jgi:hypothetical protein
LGRSDGLSKSVSLAKIIIPVALDELRNKTLRVKSFREIL